MNKEKLFEKINKNEVEKLTFEEINYITDKLLNDEIGLKLNFKEMDQKTIDNYFLLEEQKDLGINRKTDKENNLLIEGDNYHGLMALKSAGTKVDVIYIDPPYNTGREFVYNDNYKTENVAKSGKLVSLDDNHKHSKWLSFMKKRLILAKELLSDEGVIFVSMDDFENAYLKVLMDEIFGEDAFIANMPRRISSGKNHGSTISKEHDYTLIYGKPERFTGLKTDLKGYSKNDDDGRGYYLLMPLLAGTSLDERHGTQTHPVFFKNKEYKPVLKNGKSWYWRWGSERVDLGIKLNMIVEKGGRLYRKVYAELDFKQGATKLTPKVRTHLTRSIRFVDKDYMNSKGTKDGKSLGLDFSYPKPVKLLKDLVRLHTKKDALVLDFFAGSGTTGQAVMELNKEDGGNRRFILITNNERTGVDTIANPELGIARSITRERLFRTIKGIGSKGETFKWELSKDLQKDGNKYLSNESVNYLKVKEIDKLFGNFEDIDAQQEMLKRELGKDVDVIDLQKQSIYE